VDWFVIAAWVFVGVVVGWIVGVRATAKDVERVLDRCQSLHEQNTWLWHLVADRDEDVKRAEEALAKQKELLALYEDTP
jgi:alkylated DNA nucleotide flippase Atl1